MLYYYTSAKKYNNKENKLLYSYYHTLGKKSSVMVKNIATLCPHYE